MSRNLDETLPEDIQEFLSTLATEDVDEDEVYNVSDAEAYKNISQEQFADPSNRAFPCNSADRCRAAMVYLVKYYNNRADSGVTADYTNEKFHQIHNKIVAFMKKFGIEHGGCAICKKARKEAASMENDVQPTVTDTEAPVVEEAVTEEISETVETVEVPEESVEPSVEPEIEPADEPVAEEPAPVEETPAEPEVEASIEEADEEASPVAVLEASLAQKEEELAQLRGQLALQSRLASLASAGIDESYHPLIASLDDNQFAMLRDLLINHQTEEVVEEEPSEEVIAEEEPEEEVTEPDPEELSVGSLNLETTEETTSLTNFYKAIFN